MNKAVLLVLALVAVSPVAVPLVGSTGFSDKQKVACGGEYDSYAHSSLGFLTPEEFMGIHSSSEENLAPKSTSEVP